VITNRGIVFSCVHKIMSAEEFMINSDERHEQKNKGTGHDVFDGLGIPLDLVFSCFEV